MPLSDRAVTNEMLTLFIWYRRISLSVSTLIYLLVLPEGLTPLRLGVAAGMAAACGIGSFLYRRGFSDPAGSGLSATTMVENAAYGVLLILSGGFFSPYLWYFISALTVVMAAERFHRFSRRLLPASLIWCMVCAVLGGYYQPVRSAFYLSLNTGIGVLMFAGGFYTLFGYARRLEESRLELVRLNDSLKAETLRKEQVLRNMMDLYETFQLFNVTEPQEAMKKIAVLLQRTVSPGGCFLVKFGALRQIDLSEFCGLPQGHEKELLLRITETGLLFSENTAAAGLQVGDGKKYSVTFIQGPAGVSGAVAFPLECGADREETEEYRQFYLDFAGIVLYNLDLQSMAEECIISEEQNRIANEIHDTVIQKLFAMACKVRLLQSRQREMDAEEMQEQLRQVIAAAESTMKELREAIYSSRWSTGEPDLFFTKLRAYANELQSLTEVQVNLQLSGEARLMSVPQKSILYRVVCEALNNAVRHGKAGSVCVELQMTEQEWIACVTDDGTGFDKRPVSLWGQGMRNMHRMAACLKGYLLVESAVGSGTRVSCHLPR